MSTLPKNEELAQANRRAAERAREKARKMQEDRLKKATERDSPPKKAGK